MDKINILLISDSIPSKNGGGISQTLFNIFENLPNTNLIYIADKNEIIDFEDILNIKIIRITIYSISYLKNRIGAFINPILLKLNSLIIDIKKKPLSEIYSGANSYILVSTTDFQKVQIANNFHKNYRIPIISYFMDDWIGNKNFSWVSDNLQNLIKNTLNNSIGWMLISENLQNRFIDRYQIKDKKTLIIHNPVKVDDISIEYNCLNNKSDEFEIVYAGSIWDMHYDALLYFAKLVEHIRINKKINIYLSIYCKDMFWNKYKSEFSVLGVKYKGYTDYSILNTKLLNAWLLLVASSFKQEFESFTHSSVQTKLTDYMKVGRPILSIGPDYSACNQFVEKWDCGYIIDNQDYTSGVKVISNIFDDNSDYIKKSNNGRNVVKENFNQEIIQKDLLKFIQMLN